MVGNGVSCAMRVGDWDWAVALLDEWLDTDITPAYRVELLADRAVIEACRGGDPAPFLARADELLVGVTDPQFGSYVRMGRAWAAFAAGRLDEAIQGARAAATATSYFAPMGLPLAGRAAVWSDDLKRLSEVRGMLDDEPRRGNAIDADRLVIGAGIAALEGRAADALATYTEALRSWRDLGLAWDEALTAIDMATVLDPADPAVRSATDAARETLVRLGAQPFIDRLDAALAGGSATVTSEPPVRARARAGVAAGES